MTLDNILEEINKANTIVLMAHENPDGDAIGSCLAFALALKQLNKEPDVLIKEYAACYSFLPGIDMIKSTTDVEKYDLAICLDCPEITRVEEEYIDYYTNARVKVQFDHHARNNMFGDYNIVDQSSPAVCQILASSFEYMRIDLTKDIITNLIAGIITDTGGFRHSNTNADAFDFASFALTKGVNIEKIYRATLTTVTRAKFELQKLAMDRMKFFANGKIAFTYETFDDDKKLNVLSGDNEGIVEIGRTIEGVEVSIFLYEKKDGFKASLRSNEYVDVSEICMTFGGGGHLKAAAVTLDMPFEEAKNAIINETIKYIKK